MTKDELREAVNRLTWFHQIDFGSGIVGKSVLDIGCWDGFNAIEALRRGASRVMATDHWVWAHHPWASRATIELARQHIAPALEIQDIDVPDLTPATVGHFDLVLFCGVFYHLRHPFQVLEGVAQLAKETLIVETHMDASEMDRPAMIFYPGTELNGDGSNWWGPNRLCVEAMLRDLGFHQIDFTPHPQTPSRGIFRARR